jgi:hypothetical protein
MEKERTNGLAVFVSLLLAGARAFGNLALRGRFGLG